MALTAKQLWATQAAQADAGNDWLRAARAREIAAALKLQSEIRRHDLEWLAFLESGFEDGKRWDAYIEALGWAYLWMRICRADRIGEQTLCDDPGDHCGCESCVAEVIAREGSGRRGAFEGAGASPSKARQRRITRAGQMLHARQIRKHHKEIT